MPISLLVVDDNDLFRKSIGRLLRLISEGRIRDLFEADSGPAALAILDQQHVECVLLDYQMPGGNGLHWLEEIRKKHPQTAVIMVTGEGNESTAVEAMKAGAMDYLVKESLQESSLLRAILNAVERLRMAHLLHEQREQLLQAERQRAMLTSVTTACHHMGQPATVIMAYLQLMQSRETSPEMKEMIRECLTAAEGLADILHRLQQVSEYRTVPYLASEASSQQMLEI